MSTPSAPFAAAEELLTRATFSVLADVVVTPPSGEAFPAMLSAADTDASVFGQVQAGALELRYVTASAPALQAGDVVQAGGHRYRIAEPPRRIAAGRECIATLTEISTQGAP